MKSQTNANIVRNACKQSKTTNASISGNAVMTFADQIESGMNPYEDVMVESLLYHCKKLNDVEFEYAALLQLVRLNLDRNDSQETFSEMDSAFDNPDDFDALIDFDQKYSNDVHVVEGLRFGYSDLKAFLSDLAYKYFEANRHVQQQFMRTCDLCSSWSQFQTICKKAGYDADSDHVTNVLKCARREEIETQIHLLRM